MKLPHGKKAIVPDDKLFEFLLNDNHPEQPGHAILFRQLLGIGKGNAEVLRSALLHAASEGIVDNEQQSPYGTKYEIRFEMTGARETYTILSIWIIEHGFDSPRLVTAFIE